MTTARGAVLTLWAVLAIGCSSTMHTTFVNLNMSDIMVEPTDARSVRIDCQEAYWWVDDDNRVNIAGKGVQRSLIGSVGDRELLISFVLDEPSQGVGKNYQLTHNSTRGVIKTGGNFYRFQSTYGIMGTENRPSDRLVGAYRSNITLNAAGLFGGWSDPAPFVAFGTFTAVPDRDGKGKQIRNQTELDGFERRFLSTQPFNHSLQHGIYRID